jgi:hypothetical protein
MAIRIFVTLFAVVLFIGYTGAFVAKLKDIPLAIVVLVGVTMMLVDAWQSFRAGDR